MTEENRRGSATKELLKDAFWELYEKKAIDKISIREITAKAGLNRGTFYAHYLDIYDVLQQVEDKILSYMEENGATLFQFFFTQNNDDNLERFIDFFMGNEKYLKVLIGKNGDPGFIYRVKDIIKGSVLNNFPSGQEREEIEYILEYIASAHIGILNFWYERDKKKPQEELILLIKSILLQGPVHLLRERMAPNSAT